MGWYVVCIYDTSWSFAITFATSRASDETDTLFMSILLLLFGQLTSSFKVFHSSKSSYRQGEKISNNETVIIFIFII